VEPVLRESLAERLERLDALDAVADPLQSAVRGVVPEDSSLKDLLSGTWLGHPLHPPLTDVVVGAWTSAFLLDLLGGSESEQAADRLVGIGILAAVPTAASGLSDWADVRGGARRVGSVHAIGNTTALTLHALSWAARRRGKRTQALAMSGAGYAVATFSAWLGGHLSFGKGVGVDQTVFDSAPSEWTAVLAEPALPERTLVGAKADGLAVLLVRKGQAIFALDDRCSHRGCSLHAGKLNADDTVTCPCHGSTFRLDGSIARGPATAPQPSFDVRTNDGQVEIRRRA
jgi:nitrite reductase/ring-hydroxylating ferredoxin subunit